MAELRSDSNSSRDLIPGSLLQASRDDSEAAVQETRAGDGTSLALKQLPTQLSYHLLSFFYFGPEVQGRQGRG